MKSLICVFVGIALTAPSMGYAQWGPAPTQSQWAQPSNSSCQASFYIPADKLGNVEMEATYIGQCPSGLAEGYQTVRELPDEENQGNLATITCTFLAGLTNLFIEGSIDQSVYDSCRVELQKERLCPRSVY